MRMRALPAIFLFLFFCAACAPKAARQPDTTLPRPAPSYVYWLQKQSLLHAAPEIIAQVSQSSRVWLQSAAPGRAGVLLKAAPNWLLVSEKSLSHPLFGNAAALAAGWAQTGFGGIYFGDTGEKPDIWLGKGAGGFHSASFQFDPAYGGDADFENLAQTAEHAGLQLGSGLLAGATGQGPDFVLQARSASSHSGLYAMLPVPAEAAGSLPPPGREELDSLPLSQNAVDSLAAAGVIPRALARDAFPWASAGGWAVTGNARGVDGLERRWLYRYSISPLQPVFAWQDPSGLAEKVFAAAIIRHTGLLRQTLAGLHLEPLLGLEPQGPTTGRASLSPGLEAINAISRQIHRYGGWAMQADALPETAIAAVLAGNCDFCRDDVTETLVLFGLLAADGRPVASLYRERMAKDLPVARLARGLAGRIDPAILSDNPDLTSQMALLRSRGLPDAQPGQVLAPMPEEQIRLFLLTWQLGMPGLAFLPAERPEPYVARLLESRQKSGLAAGRVIKVIRGHGGGFGLLSSLPDGGHWLLACNFGVNADELDFTLPASTARAVDAATGENLGTLSGASGFRIALDGRVARNVLLPLNP